MSWRTATTSRFRRPAVCVLSDDTRRTGWERKKVYDDVIRDVGLHSITTIAVPRVRFNSIEEAERHGRGSD